VENVLVETTIVEFSDNGKKLRKIRVPKVVKTEAEWKKLLSPNAFDITRAMCLMMVRSLLACGIA